MKQSSLVAVSSSEIPIKSNLNFNKNLQLNLSTYIIKNFLINKTF